VYIRLRVGYTTISLDAGRHQLFAQRYLIRFIVARAYIIAVLATISSHSDPACELQSATLRRAYTYIDRCVTVPTDVLYRISLFPAPFGASAPR